MNRVAVSTINSLLNIVRSRAAISSQGWSQLSAFNNVMCNDLQLTNRGKFLRGCPGGGVRFTCG